MYYLYPLYICILDIFYDHVTQETLVPICVTFVPFCPSI